MTVADRGIADFAINTCTGGRPVIRLMNSACEWAKVIAGKTHFTIFQGCILNTEALSSG